MKIANILPLKYDSILPSGSYKMLLAHLKDEYHLTRDVQRNCYTIMDNSLIELGGAVNIDAILEAAEKLNPDEIVLPDVYCKGRENYECILNSINELRVKGALGKYKLMAVCHGENISEFEHYFNLIKRIPEISCIGIPKVAATIFHGNRNNAEYLWQQDCTKEIHLLGCWDSLIEILGYEHPAKIRSMDTCILSLLARDNIQSIYSDRPEKSIDFHNDNINVDLYMSFWNKLRKENFV